MGGRKRRRENCFLIVAEAAYHVAFARTQTLTGRGVNIRIVLHSFPLLSCLGKNPRKPFLLSKEEINSSEYPLFLVAIKAYISLKECSCALSVSFHVSRVLF